MGDGPSAHDDPRKLAIPSLETTDMSMAARGEALMDTAVCLCQIAGASAHAKCWRCKQLCAYGGQQLSPLVWTPRLETMMPSDARIYLGTSCKIRSALSRRINSHDARDTIHGPLAGH